MLPSGQLARPVWHRMLSFMADVTHILFQIEQGDPSAAEQLLPLVYDELRKLAAARLANEKSGQTLQATALVHEAYLEDDDTRLFIETHNPAALREIAERLNEAMARGMWTPRSNSARSLIEQLKGGEAI